MLPRTLQHLMASNATGAAWPKHCDAVIEDHIASAYQTKEHKIRHALRCKRNFVLLCPPRLLPKCERLVKLTANYHKDAQLNRMQSQLKRLCDKSVWNKSSFSDCVVNLSNYTLDQTELQLLGLGLSFSLQPRAETGVDVLEAINNLQSRAYGIAPELQTLKGFVLTGLNNLANTREALPRRYNKALQALQRNPNLIILKADKGSKVVVMDKDEYLSEGELMLSNINVYEHLRKNPISVESTAYNTELKDIYKAMGLDVPSRYTTLLPILPYMYFSPKIHKDPLSYRPIVSQRRSFTAPLAKHLADILSPLMGRFSSAHIRNSVELKSFLQENADPSLPLLSLDVESLFTNVPIEPLLEFLHRKHG